MPRELPCFFCREKKKAREKSPAKFRRRSLAHHQQRTHSPRRSLAFASITVGQLVSSRPVAAQ